MWALRFGRSGRRSVPCTFHNTLSRFAKVRRNAREANIVTIGERSQYRREGAEEQGSVESNERAKEPCLSDLNYERIFSRCRTRGPKIRHGGFLKWSQTISPPGQRYLKKGQWLLVAPGEYKLLGSYCPLTREPKSNNDRSVVANVTDNRRIANLLHALNLTVRWIRGSFCCAWTSVRVMQLCRMKNNISSTT